MSELDGHDYTRVIIHCDCLEAERNRLRERVEKLRALLGEADTFLPSCDNETQPCIVCDIKDALQSDERECDCNIKPPMPGHTHGLSQEAGIDQDELDTLGQDVGDK